MSTVIAIVVITGRAHCFHYCKYKLYPSCFCEIWALFVSWITSDNLYKYIHYINIYTNTHTHTYIYIYIYIYIHLYINIYKSQTIDRFTKEQLINDSIANGLKNPSPRTLQFYISPKIHKEGNPGRPVVSSINCHTANTSKYVDYQLRPIVKQIPSYDDLFMIWTG